MALKLETGATPARFVVSGRLEAARVLVESSWPLKTVAARCGFASADVFGRRFRQRFGVTPQYYRDGFTAC